MVERKISKTPFLEKLVIKPDEYGKLTPGSLYGEDTLRLANNRTRLIFVVGPVMAGKSRLSRELIEQSERHRRLTAYLPFEGAQYAADKIGEVKITGLPGGHSPEEYAKQTRVFEEGIRLAEQQCRNMDPNIHPELSGADLIIELPSDVGRGERALINIFRADFLSYAIMLLPSNAVYEKASAIRSKYGSDPEKRVQALAQAYPNADIGGGKNIHIGGAGPAAIEAFESQQNSFYERMQEELKAFLSLYKIPVDSNGLSMLCDRDMFRKFPGQKYIYMAKVYYPYLLKEVVFTDEEKVGIWHNECWQDLPLDNDPLAPRNYLRRDDVVKRLKGIFNSLERAKNPSR